MENNQDQIFMAEALKEAQIAYKKNEVPVGCVIVIDNKIIARAHNKKVKHKNALSHAEVLCIKKASKKLKQAVLDEATLYVTLEPCLMCAGLIINSRIKRVVYATKEPKFGAMGSILDVTSDIYKFNHHVSLTSGILKEESSNLLKAFFKARRK